MTAKPFRIILGLDPHQEAAGLLRAAAEFASRLHAQVDVVEVLDFANPDQLATGWPGGLGAGLPGPTGVMDDPATERAALEHLRRTVAETGAFETTSWEAHVTRGLAATRLSTFARERGADLIAIGAPSRGWSEWLHHLLSGSVAHDLERSCQVPLLMLPNSSR
jgi:nucleotide-binding universal stress UspA family protein